jgi:hypothetical protein
MSLAKLRQKVRETEDLARTSLRLGLPRGERARIWKLVARCRRSEKRLRSMIRDSQDICRVRKFRHPPPPPPNYKTLPLTLTTINGEEAGRADWPRAFEQAARSVHSGGHLDEDRVTTPSFIRRLEETVDTH